MPAVAITDTGNLFGALDLRRPASRPGCSPSSVRAGAASRRAGGQAARTGTPPEPDRIVVLVQSEAGYRNLSTLVSKAFLETAGGETPQVEIAISKARRRPYLPHRRSWRSGRRLLGDGQRRRRSDAAAPCGIFPRRLYVELMRHGVTAEDRIEGALAELAFRHDLPLVATNDCFFPDEEFYEAHDALLCIAEGTVVGQRERKR